ncbi:hypothetical protein ACFS07_31085 [Undibacterium arcticum]
MCADFGWTASAQQYIDMYRHIATPDTRDLFLAVPDAQQHEQRRAKGQDKASKAA